MTAILGEVFQCAICGKDAVRTRLKQKTCSKACGKKYKCNYSNNWQKNNNKNNLETRKCICCGIEFKQNRINQIICGKRECYNKKAAMYQQGIRAYSLMETTRCKCPLCEKTHDYPIRWIGRGIPRVFCQECRESHRSIRSLDNEERRTAL